MSLSRNQELYEFMRSPEDYWGRGHRQATKLIRSRNRVASCFSSYKTFEEWISQCLEARASLHYRTLLIFNAGGSGSHWLQGMLTDLLSFPGAGEVYVPSPFHEYGDEVYAFIDLVQIIQSQLTHSVEILHPIINTTHSTTLMRIITDSGKSHNLFLVRNPVDIVLSRTYRKDEYKNYISPEVSYQEYCSKNIHFVKSIFRAARKQGLNKIIKYEELRERPELALRKILALVDCDAPDADLIRVAEAHKSDNLINAKRKGNLFTGDYQDPNSDIIEHAKQELRSEIDFHGY